MASVTSEDVGSRTQRFYFWQLCSGRWLYLSKADVNSLSGLRVRSDNLTEKIVLSNTASARCADK